MPSKSKTKRLSCHPTLGDRRLFGVEIELEGVPWDRESSEPMRRLGLTEFSEHWRITHDGTLRNQGAEFVSRNIQSQKSLRTSLHKMMKQLHDQHPVEQSLRTSSHIHIDVRELSAIQLSIFLLLLVQREQELFTIGGVGRERSPFCVPCNNPIATVCLLDRALVRRGISTSLSRTRVSHQSLKYSAINPEPISSKGSVELRHFNPIIKGAVFVRITNIILECYERAIGFDADAEVPLSRLIGRESNDLISNTYLLGLLMALYRN